MKSKVLVAALTTFLSFGAGAACNLNSMNGDWSFAVNPDNAPSQICNFQINRGQVSSGTCATIRGTASSTVVSGTVTLTSARPCVFNAAVAYNTGTISYLDASLNTSFNSAVGAFNSTTGVVGTFTGVKR